MVAGRGRGGQIVSRCKHKYQRVLFGDDNWGRPFYVLLVCLACERTKRLSDILSRRILRCFGSLRGVG